MIESPQISIITGPIRFRGKNWLLKIGSFWNGNQTYNKISVIPGSRPPTSLHRWSHSSLDITNSVFYEFFWNAYPTFKKMSIISGSRQPTNYIAYPIGVRGHIGLFRKPEQFLEFKSDITKQFNKSWFQVTTYFTPVLTQIRLQATFAFLQTWTVFKM